MLFNILAFLSIILTIILLRRLVAIFPSLIACMMRWKENVNLEERIKQSHDRDVIALAMIVPFCLIVEKFRLYDPSFIGGMGENLRIGVMVGIFLAYFLVRSLISTIARAYTERKRTYAAADKAAYTFFIMLALILLAIGGILSFLHVDAAVIRITMLCISAFMYGLFMLRKFQIFSSVFSIFTCFLYLCALEIIPTGFLIASALIF